VNVVECAKIAVLLTKLAGHAEHFLQTRLKWLVPQGKAAEV